MNKMFFRSVMIMHGDTNKTLAEYLGKSAQSVSNKINERGTEFTQGEIAAIAQRYNLTPEQIMAIFFAKKVS